MRARYKPSVIRDVIWGRQADASAIVSQLISHAENARYRIAVLDSNP